MYATLSSGQGDDGRYSRRVSGKQSKQNNFPLSIRESNNRNTKRARAAGTADNRPESGGGKFPYRKLWGLMTFFEPVGRSVGRSVGS